MKSIVRRSEQSTQVEKDRRKRLLRWFSLLYLIVVSTCLVHSYWAENSAYGDSSVAVAVLGRDGLEHRMAYRDSDAGRSAALARAGAALWTLLYALGVGAVVGPRPLRLVSGNLLFLVALLLGTEASLKLSGIHFPALVRHTSDRDFWVYDRTKGWYHRSGGTGAAPLYGPDQALVRINSLGFRGREISPRKPGGVKRVLVVGDSYVFGLGVDEEHSFTTHLETFRNARFADDVVYEVVNMGVSGYSTDQEYILFQEIGMGLSPDVVILVICDNDFLANTESFAYRRYYKPYFELDSERELSLRGSPVPLLSRVQRAKLFLGQESTLWNFVRSRRSDHIRPVLDFFEVDTSPISSVSEIDITAKLIAEFAERVDAAGARLLAINTGHRGERTPLFHELRPRLARLGISQLGLEELLGHARRNNPDMLWDFGVDGHWNREANRLAAEIVAGHLFRHRLLSEDASL